jgi:hypothetical protein
VTKIVLLAVAAAWAAVLLPPLLRSRTENRPGSSVSDFNRQLSSLQRSVPTRGMAPMRSMSRPLAPSPLGRPAAGGRPGQLHRSASLHAVHSRELTSTAAVARRSHGEPGTTRTHESTHRQAHVQRRPSNREELRRRRANVFFMLLMAACATLFLAATTHASSMMYAFALSFLSLCGYCYKLVQIRQIEQQSTGSYSDNTWFRAA